MFKIIRFELYKLFRDKKLYILSAILSLFVVLLAIIAKTADSGNEMVSFNLNGQNLPYYALNFVTVQLAPILIMVLTSGYFADEENAGTLKLALLRPVKRWELAVAKIVSVSAGIFTLLISSMLTGYIAGTLILGWGEGLNIYPLQLKPLEGIISMMGAYFTTFLPFLALGIVVLFLSMVLPSGGIVIGVSLGFYFFMAFAGMIVEKLGTFMLGTYMSIGISVLQGSEPGYVLDGIMISLLYIAVFSALNIIVLNKKDITT